MQSTAKLYIEKRPKAKSTAPTMSVAQCTPETSLPKTMNTENAMTNALVAFMSNGLFDLRPTW